MAQVSLRNVRKVYPNGFEAVKNLTLDIGDGEFVVLVGPSGCGKSTTLRMVAGLEEASSGDISIGNRIVNDVHPKDRDIAMVFQNYALYPHMSVRKNMAFALKLRGMPHAEIEHRVTSAAKVLGIEHLLDRKPRELSGGQKQRVAVGRAIVREPKAFLFDEPLSNLDAKLRVSTRAELKSLHQRLKTTTMYVTHDQEEAMTLGDRIVVMSNGEIQQCDAPLKVYQHPRNRFVAGFIGTPQMNFFTGRVKEEGSGLKFVEDGPEGTRLEFGLPPERQGLRSVAGQDLVLGLRPTMLKESAHGQAVRIRVVEPLGDAMDVSFETPSNPHVVARVPARVGLVPGETMRLTPDAQLAHFFEPGEFGRNLSEGNV